MTLVNSTVAMSAQPIGRPGWPELAFSTASMDSDRMALAMSFWVAEFVMKSRFSFVSLSGGKARAPRRSEA
jgi:hypothetical protein